MFHANLPGCSLFQLQGRFGPGLGEPSGLSTGTISRANGRREGLSLYEESTQGWMRFVKGKMELCICYIAPFGSMGLVYLPTNLPYKSTIHVDTDLMDPS